MTAPTLNFPSRKREEKCKRKEGKSQCRGGCRSKTVPVVQCAPAKTPLSCTTVTVPPPVVAVPQVVTVPVTLQANLLREPSSLSPNVHPKEGKVVRRKAKVEKEPPKATVRKKKNSASSTEAKASGENDGRSGAKNDKNKNSLTSSNSRRRKSPCNGSDGSKEKSESIEKNRKNFNKDLAHNFFKHMMESQKSRKRSDDTRIETMPESSQINVSARAFRRKVKGPKKKPLDANFFKPNGDPVWVIPERSVNDYEKGEDGVAIRNPELATAMAEDNLELDEKSWFDHISTYISCAMPKGTSLPEDYQFDTLAPYDTLEANSDYVTQETVAYNTVKNLVDLSEEAIKRFSMKREGIDENASTKKSTPESAAEPMATTSPNPSTTSLSESSKPKTGTVSTVTFNMKSVLCLKYDRHHPICSIQRLRKKMVCACLVEQPTQVGSKEKG